MQVLYRPYEHIPLCLTQPNGQYAYRTKCSVTDILSYAQAAF